MQPDSVTPDQTCPCQSGKSFTDCCSALIQGATHAATAEALMRSRYTAFCVGAVDYLIDTTAAEKRHPEDHALIAEQTQITNWTGLSILATEAGTEDDEKGVVEFEAHFEAPEGGGVLHERSRFRKDKGRWYYVDGEVELLSD